MLLLPWPLAARAATLVVDPAGGGDHPTIGAAVGAAADGDVIVVAPGDYDEGPVDLEADLRIVGRDPGAPPVLHSASADGFFRVAGGEVLLRDLGFVGEAEAQRRAIVQTGGDLSVQGCTFSAFSTAGTAGEAGGGAAVRVEGGTLVLEHATFLDNAATYGGHLWVGSEVEVEARHSTFDGGHASFSGGAVSVAPDARFVARFSRFEANTAGKSGGAVGPASTDGGSVELTDCVFAANTATATVGDGGAVAIVDAQTGVNRIERSLFCGNRAGRWGGALLAENGSVTVLRSAFVANRLEGSGLQQGGAIRAETAIALDYVTMLDNVGALGRAVSAGAFVTNVRPSLFANYGQDARTGTLFHEGTTGEVTLQPGSTLFDVGTFGIPVDEDEYSDEDPGLALRIDPCDPTGLIPPPSSPVWDAPDPAGALIDADGDGTFGLDGDCDDENPSVGPGELEQAGDGLDQDCDGFELCHADADGDGNGEIRQIQSYDLDCSGFGEAPDDDGDCVGAGAGDADADGVCDDSDVCPDGSDHDDADADGTPDACDPCPDDPGDTCVPTSTGSETLPTIDRTGGVIAADGQLPGCTCTSAPAAPSGGLLLVAAAVAYRRKDRTSHRRGRAHASR